MCVYIVWTECVGGRVVLPFEFFFFYKNNFYTSFVFCLLDRRRDVLFLNDQEKESV